MEIKKLQSFKGLIVWQKSSDLAVLIYKITEKFPRSELYGLTNQMRRAVISIGSNIAEGFKRNHKKEKLQFYNIAYGSAAELESQIEIALKLNFLNKEEHQKLNALTVEVEKMLDGLIKSVSRSPKSPKSYILNSIFCILALYSIFYILTPSPTNAAVLYFSPQDQTIYQGDTFLVEVKLDTEGEEINTVQVNLKFQQDLLEAVDFNKGNSILTLWPEEPNLSNQEGVVSFIGGMPSGYQGDGLLGKIIFRVIPRVDPRPSASIIFQDNSKILLNDGKGTPARLSFREGSYEVIEKSKELPVVSSGTHPDQNKWYKSPALLLHWKLVEGAEYSYLLSRDSVVEPDETPDRPEGELIWMGDMNYDLKKEGDGIYYFNLRQKLPGKDWQKEISYFRIMIDATYPEEFEPQIGQDKTIFGGKYFLSFAAQDKTSGIDHYEIKEQKAPIFYILNSKSFWEAAESPYLLKDQNLRSRILVKAVDKAGNEKIVEILPPYKVSWKDILPWVILAMIIGFIIRWIVRRVKKHD